MGEGNIKFKYKCMFGFTFLSSEKWHFCMLAKKNGEKPRTISSMRAASSNEENHVLNKKTSGMRTASEPNEQLHFCHGCHTCYHRNASFKTMIAKTELSATSMPANLALAFPISIVIVMPSYPPPISVVLLQIHKMHTCVIL